MYKYLKRINVFSCYKQPFQRKYKDNTNINIRFECKWKIHLYLIPETILIVFCSVKKLWRTLRFKCSLWWFCLIFLKTISFVPGPNQWLQSIKLCNHWCKAYEINSCWCNLKWQTIALRDGIASWDLKEKIKFTYF